MKRVLAWLLVASLMGLGGLPAAGVQEPAQAGQSSVSSSRDLDNILIQNEGYEKRKKGPVRFPHRRHALDAGILCWECHHDYRNNENVWSPWGETQTCKSCHGASEAGQNPIRLQKAYHLSCKKCHEALVKAKKKAGEFRKCKGCHLPKK